MKRRRRIALLLLVTIGASSIEVVLSDAGHAAADSGIRSVAAQAPPAEGISERSPLDDPPPADCACLCACGCVNAQVVVIPAAGEPPIVDWESLPSLDQPTVFILRPRPRPDLRPPLA